jgi:hypothetical protein
VEERIAFAGVGNPINSSLPIEVLNLDNLIAEPIVIRKAIKEMGDKLNVKSYPKIKTSKSETLFPDNLKSWKTTTPGTTPLVITSVIESKCLPKFGTEIKALAAKHQEIKKFS